MYNSGIMFHISQLKHTYDPLLEPSDYGDSNEGSVLQIRKGNRDNFPYFSIKTYIVTHH